MDAWKFCYHQFQLEFLTILSHNNKHSNDIIKSI